jgi:hypothetical protein
LAASSSPTGAFFPLTIGNRWHATADARSVLQPAGGGPPIEEFSSHSDISRELTGTEELFGRSYVILQETTVETVGNDPPSVPLTWWTRYRQDATGLYEADAFLTQPPASSSGIGTDARVVTGPVRRQFPMGLRARLPVEQIAAYERAWNDLQDRIAAARRWSASPGSELRSTNLMSDEITRLDYPMHPGGQWTIRPDPYFASTVEGVDHLRLPAGDFPAYRIRIDSEAFGPDDSVHFWFGRSGQLQAQVHLTGIATDVDGNEIGRFVFDYREAVDVVSLAKP